VPDGLCGWAVGDDPALVDDQHALPPAQKLEVVGQLAGGIAHDFNNLLMVIGANAEFVLSDESDPTARREAAVEIKDTTKRAAALTKQLLARLPLASGGVLYYTF